MVAQNTVQALAFLATALTAGFVEEFVFRGIVMWRIANGKLAERWAYLENPKTV